MNRPLRPCPEWDEPPEFVVIERIDAQLQTDPSIQAILNSALADTAGEAFPPSGALGQVYAMQGVISIPSFSLSPPYDTILNAGPALPAGDWLLWPSAVWQRPYPGVSFSLTPPAGFSGSLAGGFWGGPSTTSTMAAGVPCHARTTGNSGLVFNVHVNPGAGVFAVGTFTLTVQALRIR